MMCIDKILANCEADYKGEDVKLECWNVDLDMVTAIKVVSSKFTKLYS